MENARPTKTTSAATSNGKKLKASPAPRNPAPGRRESDENRVRPAGCVASQAPLQGDFHGSSHSGGGGLAPPHDRQSRRADAPRGCGPHGPHSRGSSRRSTGEPPAVSLP